MQVPELAGIQDRKYLDHTGLHLQSAPLHRRLDAATSNSTRSRFTCTHWNFPGSEQAG
jgi:hypothetical protein